MIGNIHELSNLAEIHENEIVSPAPFCHSPKDIPGFLQSLSTEVGSSDQGTVLPTSLEEWVEVQGEHEEQDLASIVDHGVRRAGEEPHQDPRGQEL